MVLLSGRKCKPETLVLGFPRAVGWYGHGVAARAIVELGMNDQGGRWLGPTSAEAARHLERDGANALAVAHEPAWRRIARLFRSPIA